MIESQIKKGWIKCNVDGSFIDPNTYVHKRVGFSETLTTTIEEGSRRLTEDLSKTSRVKIMVEFCVIKGNFASITLDLLPKNLRRTSSSDIGKINCQETMADLLQKAIQSIEDRKMAMLYISHADETERRARIERVKQGIEENKAASSVHLTRITKELDKGKGHVFSYTELLKSQHHDKSMQLYIPQTQKKGEKKDEDIISSSSEFSTSSAPLAPMGLGFQLGPSSEGRVIGNTGAGKSQKRRRASWKRRVPGKGVSPFVASSPGREEDQPANAKRKAGFEDMVRLSWEGGTGDRSCTMDRIRRCRRKIMEWKRKSNLNSRDRITRVSWSSASMYCGAGWIIRNSVGKVLLHSRRSFSGVRSPVQAGLLAITWATTSVKEHKLRNVQFEFSSSEAADALNNPLDFPLVYAECYKALGSVYSLPKSSIALVHGTCNKAASAIADSVISGQRFHSYVSSGGPRWLAMMLDEEATSS
ncbi:hypothetical protein HID58_092020 [Brassica napus]|uniref:RNase H type-1 domain-containing protein n=1 Tax=Brassica napus TaxID=3708 RepID=A0ABQ7WXS9_BRANA|nr:hypothetical protein HID58_092020 [Brassica napus]